MTFSLALNAAGQVKTRTISNSAWNFGLPTGNDSYSRDGLNRYTAVDAVSFSYDARQNLTNDGARTLAYDLENRLLSASGPTAVTLAHDPLGRLYQSTAGGVTTTFLYAGDELVAEYNAAGSRLSRRRVRG